MWNAEETILRCVDSILRQRYDDYEVLCIDDGSTDKTREVLSKVVSSKIRVIATEHKGVSHARNVGIGYATGKYVLFCDADDEYFPDAFDVISKHLESDIVFFGAKVVDCDKRFVLNDIVMPKIHCDNDIQSMFFSQAGVWPYVWHCAYKTDMLKTNNICFDENLVLGEDLAFQYECFLVAKSVDCIEDMLYKYYHCRQQSSEIAFLQDPVRRLKGHIKIVERCYDAYSKQNKKIDKRFYQFAFDFLYCDVASVNNLQYKLVRPYLKKSLFYTGVLSTTFAIQLKIKFCIIAWCRMLIIKGNK